MKAETMKVPPLVRIEDAKLYLGVGRTYTYTLINDKKLKTVKQGKRTMITGDSVVEYVNGL